MTSEENGCAVCRGAEDVSLYKWKKQSYHFYLFLCDINFFFQMMDLYVYFDALTVEVPKKSKNIIIMVKLTCNMHNDWSST